MPLIVLIVSLDHGIDKFFEESTLAPVDVVVTNATATHEFVKTFVFLVSKWLFFGFGLFLQGQRFHAPTG